MAPSAAAERLRPQTLLRAAAVAALASGVAVALAVMGVLLAAPERPPGWEGVRVVLLAGGVGFAATALLALVPAGLGTLALARLRRRGAMPMAAVTAACGVAVGWALVWLLLGTLEAPLWVFAALAGAAAGLSAQRVLTRAGAR